MRFFHACALTGALGLLAAATAQPLHGQNYTFSVFAGTYGQAGVQDGTGTGARFDKPRGLEFDRSGNLLVSHLNIDISGATYDSPTIRKISPAGVVTTLAPSNFPQMSSSIYDLAVDSEDNIYATDSREGKIIKITPEGVGSVWASDLGATVSGVAVGGTGNVYATSTATGRIWRILPNGDKSIFAQLPASLQTGPRGVAVDASSKVYVSLPGQFLVQQFNPGGIPGAGYLNGAFGLAADRAGDVYAFTPTGSPALVNKFFTNGTVATLPVFYPQGNFSFAGSSSFGIAVDEIGNVFVGDESNHVIWRGLTSHPLNDAFALAANLTGNRTSVQLRNFGATKEAGEPNHAGNPGGHSVWFKWTAPSSGPVLFDTNGSSVAGLLAVYAGESVNALTSVADSGNGNILFFNATAATTYYLAVDGRNGATGNITLNLNDSTVLAWGPAPISNGTNLIGPTAVPSPLFGVIALAADNNSVALRSDGTVVAWGNFGLPTNLTANVSNAVSIAPSGSGGAAVRADGTVTSWNLSANTSAISNASAVALGSSPLLMGVVLRRDGTTTPLGSTSFYPAGLRDVVAVAAGKFPLNAVGALRNDGFVLVWPQPSFSAPPVFTDAVAIALASSAGVALRSNGTVTAWGSGVVATSVPAGLGEVIAIAAGANHAVALRSDGSLVGWGSNTSGQLGFPAGLTGVVGIAAGTSHTLALLPGTAPKFSAQPVSTTISAGQRVTLTAWANALEYQWYEGQSGDTTTPVAGATKPWLVLPSLGQNTSFWVRATNIFGTGDSATANVTAYPPPANDAFANAAPLAGSSLQISATNAGATLESGEATLMGASVGLFARGAHSVWWTWTAPTDGVLVLDTMTSDFNTLLGIYTGAAVDALTEVQFDNDSGGNTTSRIAINAVAGGIYRIRGDGANGALGNLNLRLAFAPMSSAKAAWLVTHFTAAQLADPQVSSDLAAPGGDGVANLLKYAFNLNPWAGAPPLLPVPQLSGGTLALNFSALRGDLDYTVQVSTDLINWTTAGLVVEVDGAATAAAYDLAQSPTGRAFFRIVVAPKSAAP